MPKSQAFNWNRGRKAMYRVISLNINGIRAGAKKGFFELIEIEIIMGDYYQKYSSFFEIEKYLVKNKYRLIALDKRLNIFNDSRLYCNALYLRKDLYKKI